MVNIIDSSHIGSEAISSQSPVVFGATSSQSPVVSGATSSQSPVVSEATSSESPVGSEATSSQSPAASPINSAQLCEYSPPSQTNGRLKRYKNYKVSFKIHVVNFAETNSVRAAHRKFGPCTKMIRSWRKDKAKLLLESSKTFRCRVSKPIYTRNATMETALYKWLTEKRESGVCVSKAMVRKEALRIKSNEVQDNGPVFTASNGWFLRFLKRKHLSLRRITTSGRGLPKNVEHIVDSFLSFCHANFLNINRDLLCKMDETSIYLDSPSHITYNPIGDKRIPSVTTGNERTRISVAFTASASGFKLKPLILIPRKKPLKDFLVQNNVIVVYGTKGTFNENIIAEAYLTRVIEPYMNEKKSRVVDLLIDHSTCHLTTKVKLALKSRNKANFIPKRLTNLLQPADVSWMRPLKHAYHVKWND